MAREASVSGKWRPKMSLEKEFVLLMASVSRGHNPTFPRVPAPDTTVKLTQTRTVYSVGEALLQKERKQDAQLGRSSRRNSGS